MAVEQHIPFLTIFIPIMAAVVTAIVRQARIARWIMVGTLLVSIILSGVLIVYLLNSGTTSFVYNLGKLPAPWVNTLFAGMIEALLSFVFGIVLLLSILGGMKEAMIDLPPKKLYLYYLFLNLLYATLLALVYTNDIFTAYVFLEINTIAACAVIVINENGDTLRATIKYFIMAAVGSGLFVFTLAILYGITGHLAIDSLAVSIQGLYESGAYQLPLTVSLVLFFIALGIKSALFPFHNWLPDAHSSATPTSSAILSGLVLKGYIVLFMKVVYRVYGVEIVEALNVFPVIFATGVLSMMMGSVLALVQKDIKKMIAYSSVAQMGYIFAGIGLGTTLGFMGAIFHIIAHAVTKSCLFLTAGKAMHETGIRDVTQYHGIGRRLPVVMGVFAIAGLSMIGIPPSMGFSSKWNLAVSALHSDKVWMVVYLTISALLNMGYYMPIIIRSFFAEERKQLPKEISVDPDYTYIPMVILGSLVIIFGIYSNTLLDLIGRGLAVW